MAPRATITRRSGARASGRALPQLPRTWARPGDARARRSAQRITGAGARIGPPRPASSWRRAVPPRATIGPDGSPPRGPVVAGPAPSALHRPPDRGRVKPDPSPSPTRLGGYRRIERRRGLPLPIKAFLAVVGRPAGRGDPVGRAAGRSGRSSPRSPRGSAGFVAQVGNVAGSPTPTEVPGPRRLPDHRRPGAARTPTTRRSTSRSTCPRLSPAIDGYSAPPVRDAAGRGPGAGRSRSPSARPRVQVHGRRRAAPTAATTCRPRSWGPAGESERSEVATWSSTSRSPRSG